MGGGGYVDHGNDDDDDNDVSISLSSEYLVLTWSASAF